MKAAALLSALVCSFLLAAACATPDRVVADKRYDPAAHGRIAVVAVAFEKLPDSAASLQGTSVAAEIVTHGLLQAGYKVVDRQLLTSLMEEHKLQLSDVVSPSGRVRAGEMLGAAAFVSGTASAGPTPEEPGELTVRLAIKLVDVETGELLFHAQLEEPEQKSVEDGLRACMGALTRELKRRRLTPS